MKKLTFKNTAIGLISISGIMALFGDLMYGSKEVAEEYLFGLFIANISNFAFTIFSIMILVALLFIGMGKLHPIILEKIKFEDDALYTTDEMEAKK